MFCVRSCFNMFSTNWSFFIVFLVIILVITRPASLHPQNGLHVELKSNIKAPPSQWTIMNGWELRKPKGGHFQDAVSISDTASTINIEAPGLYYLSLYMFFEQPFSTGLIIINVTSNANNTYISKSQGRSKHNGIALNEVLMLDTDGSVVVNIFCEREIDISKTSRLILQYLSSYNDYFGFIANPKLSVTLPSNNPQLLVDWNSALSLHHGFSKTTGAFIPLQDGFYLVNVKLVLENVFGRIQGFVYSGNNRILLFEEYYESNIEYATLTYTTILRLHAKHQVLLKLNTRSTRAVVHQTSSYSIVFLKRVQLKDQSPLRIYNLEDEELIEANNQGREITMWHANDTNFVVDGKFHVSGYYFVALNIFSRTKSNKADNFQIEMEVNGASSFPLLQKQTEIGGAYIFHGVIFLRKSGFLSCKVKGKGRVTLLESSNVILQKIIPQMYSSLYTINPSVSLHQTTNSTFLNLQEIHVADRNKVTSISSNIDDAFYVTFQESGLYDVAVNLYLANSTKTEEHVVLLKQCKENHQNRHWEEITRCIFSSSNQCFLSIALNATRGDKIALKSNFKGSELSLLVKSTSYIQLTYLNSINDIVGFSKYIQVNSTTRKVICPTKGTAKKGEMMFQNKISCSDITLKGYYTFSLNLLISIQKHLETISRLKIQLKKGRKTKFITEAVKKNTTLKQLSVIDGFELDLGDTIDIQISLLDNEQVEWFSHENSVMSLVLISRNSRQYFQADEGQPLHYSTQSIFPQSYLIDKSYYEYYVDLRAKKTCIIMLKVTLILTAHTQSESNYMRINIVLNDKETYLSASRENLRNEEEVVLHISGVFTVLHEDLVKVNIHLNSDLTFDTLPATSMTIFVLSNHIKDSIDSTYFRPVDIGNFVDEASFQTPETKISYSGSYIVILKILNDDSKTNRTKRSNPDKDDKKEQNIQIINVINQNIQRNVFNIKCSECTSKQFVTYVNLAKDSYIKYNLPSLQQQNIILRYRMNQNKGFTKLYLDQDTGICLENESDKFISTWKCADGRSCLSRTGFYRASKLSLIIVNFNVFVETEDKDGFLQLQGYPLSTQNLTKDSLGNHNYYFHLTKQMLIKPNEVLQLRMICGNATAVVKKNSMITISTKESYPSKVQEEFPIFTVHPSPKITTESYEFNYTCSTDEIYGDVAYQWNKVDLNTGQHEKNLSNQKYFSVYGQPEESGHYYCVANHDGFKTQSHAATLNIQDDDECYLLTNHTIRQQMNISITSCHKNANCYNTIGSYYCQCKPGFMGDGFYCEDINECSQSPCHSNATCENTEGSHICQCKKGWRGNGTFCEDINECEEHGDQLCYTSRKSNETYCNNTIGSYLCPCKEGYHEKNGICVDINECFQEVYPCDSNAICQNTEGSHYCRCEAGWQGNGTFCEDIDECADEKLYDCALNSSCVNYDGYYRCICDNGFKGDGLVKCEPLGCFPPKGCTGEFKVSWWKRKPYIEESPSNKPDGLFYNILHLLIQDICNNCSQIFFSSPYNNSEMVENAVEAGNLTDFGCPLYGSKEQEKFRGYPFIPIVESPGVAFFVKEVKRQASPLISSLAGSWPILIATLILASLSGIIIWFLDNITNPDEFPSTFIQGSWEGFWWAFITMTTVGYGDKAPRSLSARCFGVVWIIVSMVVMSTFTATITTVLTTTSLSSHTKLYGTKVGALANSEEFRLGVKRNANIKGFDSVPDIVEAMDNGEIQGALIDSYIAGEYQDDLKKYILQEILEHTFVYGVVLSRDAIVLENALRENIERRQSEIYNVIARAIKPLKHNRGSAESIKSSTGLISEDVFRFVMIIGAICICVLLLIGRLCDWFWREKRKKDSVNKSKDFDKTSRDTNGKSSSINIIENQRSAYKREIQALRQQIINFSTVWVKRLNELEDTHEKELGKVHNWLTKTNFKSYENDDEATARLFNSKNNTFV